MGHDDINYRHVHSHARKCGIHPLPLTQGKAKTSLPFNFHSSMLTDDSTLKSYKTFAP